jgi:hypothetical protein
MFKSPQHKFEVGNSYGKGRPRGSRNRLTARVFEDVLAHWNEPVEGRNISKGMAALEVMQKEKPAEYVKAVLALLPRELILADTALDDLADDQIDAMLATLRKQVLASAAGEVN